MSKNTVDKQSFRRYSPGARVAGPRKNFLDHFAGWLGSRSRLVRFVISGFIALIMMAALVLVVLGLVGNFAAGGFEQFLIDHPEVVTVILIALVIVGMACYWIGWRLMIGFDRGDTPLEPGRAASLWVIFGLLVLITMIVLAAFTVADALSA